MSACFGNPVLVQPPVVPDVDADLADSPTLLYAATEYV
jgi:hypothetical protein